VSQFTVLFDACVLYGESLRDLIMRLAVMDLFRAKWTEEIHEEWMSHLLENRPDLSREQLERTRMLMNQHARDPLVTGYKDLIPSLSLPDPDDRHVLAAAIRANAATIVTYNLKDFPDSELAQYDIEAQHPDDFLVCQIGLSEGTVCAAAKRHRASLQNPPRTVDEYLASLERHQLPQTVSRLREFSALI